MYPADPRGTVPWTRRAGSTGSRTCWWRTGRIRAVGPGSAGAGGRLRSIDAAGQGGGPGLHRRGTCTCGCRAWSIRKTCAPVRRLAVRGGFIGVVCMPNTRPVIDNAPLVAHVLDLAAREGLVPGLARGGDHQGVAGRGAGRDRRDGPGGRLRRHRRRPPRRPGGDDAAGDDLRPAVRPAGDGPLRRPVAL